MTLLHSFLQNVRHVAASVYDSHDLKGLCFPIDDQIRIYGEESYIGGS